MNYSKGSEWRKWDLHLHTPFTKCSDGYDVPTNKDVWEEYCTEIESSDVAVFGITDYFSVDNFFIFTEKFLAKYPNSKKIFIPNIELRLNESVNSVQEEVHMHILLRPDISKVQALNFLSKLKTEKTDGNGKKMLCSELKKRSGQNDFEAATVTRGSITEAFEETFGKRAIRQDHLLIFAAVNNDGIRPERGKKRKEIITDEIDKFCDGFFGGSQNTTHFLDKDRLDDKNLPTKEKPVVSGTDAHNIEDLKNWLGKIVRDEANSKEITWIKADPTYDGLLQILIEPSDRVYIGATQPDEKEGYKVIKKIKFSGTQDFPSEIVFNSNLSSIIGSRSSGKSALINYIAHSVDKTDTEAKLPGGPAANKKWTDVNFTYSVEWNDGSSDGTGKVIFLPQNYLYNISSKPREITEKIKPVLFSKFPVVAATYSATENSIASCNKAIDAAVKRWFDYHVRRATLEQEIKNIGDKKLIENAKNRYEGNIQLVKSTLSLTDEDVSNYQMVSLEIAQKESQYQVAKKELDYLKTQYINPNRNEAIEINVEYVFNPSLNNLPYSLNAPLQEIISKNKNGLSLDLKKLIEQHKVSLEKSVKELIEAISKIKTENQVLIEKHKQSEELSKMIDESNKQENLLGQIKTKDAEIKTIDENIQAEIKIIQENLKARDESIEEIMNVFDGLGQENNTIIFGVENDFNQDHLASISDCFNLKETKNNPYISEDKLVVNGVRKNVANFLNDVRSGSIKLKMYQDLQELASDALTFTEEVRFFATMEDDKIGGFSPSSMTPGKQALFALTLILDESNDSWPLLIDQPEDDLDSRSIYNYIAMFLKRKKKERQVIMVSHNANLVIGADSEQLIVANKHGDDRKNRGNQMFNYLSGSLENTQKRNTSGYVLETCGIREHACDILDGGEEAFEKRKNKYKI